MEQIVSNYGLYAAYALIAIALIAAIVLPLVQSFSNPRALLGALVGIVVIAVIFFIGYSVSGDEVTTNYIRNNVTSATTSKMIGGAVITMYILVGITIVSIIVSEISNIFN